MRLGLAVLACAVFTVAVPAAALAQAGFYITPSLRLSEEFDDNVFVTSSGQRSDLITRFTPGVELGYRSEPFTLLARSYFDSEIYVDNSQLDDAAARKFASLELKYLPYRLLTLSLDVGYTDTTTPTGLTGAAGLQLARSHATELVAIPVAAYQLTPLDLLKLRYWFARDTVEGEPTLYVHRIEPSVSHQFTSLDTGLLSYRASIFQTEGLRTVSSHAPTVGWIRQLTPVTSITVQAGPRFIDDGSVEPEVHARLEHAFKVARVALDYQRTDGIRLGTSGPIEVETIAGSVEMEPLKLLTVKVGPSYTRTFGGVLEPTPTIRVYSLGMSAAYPITSWLTARASYSFAYQDQSGPDIHRNLVTISLDAAYPIRITP
jgi:hypothetical protein